MKRKTNIEHIVDLDEKSGGTPVLTIEWGFDSDVKMRDKLLEREK